MATLIPGGHVTGSGKNPAASRTYQCVVCNKVLKSRMALLQHTDAHNKVYYCDFANCGAEFPKRSQLTKHKHSKHGQNSFIHICHMKDCNRAGLAMASFSGLVTHLKNYHQGATMDDNKRAAVYSQNNPNDESPNDEEGGPDAEEEGGSDEDVSNTAENNDVTMTEETTHSSDAELDSQDGADENDPPRLLSLEYYKYRVQVLERRISAAEDRLAENDLKHVLEVRNLHTFYRSKIQDLEDLVEEREGQ
ncbi:hypothetical protein PG984_005160 [Apiospora sp. TS-2023a]